MEKKESKQLNFMIPKQLHREAKIKAAESGRPLAEILRELLEEWTRKRQEQK